MSTRFHLLEAMEDRRLFAAAVSAAHAGLTAVADLTGDGRADVVAVEPVATGTAGRFKVITSAGDGRGNFAQRTVRELAITRPIAVVAGELLNAHVGSVVVSPASALSSSGLVANVMLPFNGNTWQFQSNLHNSSGLAVGDGSWALGRIDSDGLNDLVRLDRNGMVKVFRNSGCFTFDGGSTESFVFFGGNAKQLSLGDFDGDGSNDMAAITSFGVQVAPAIGGNPCAPPITLSLGTGNTPKTLTSADANGDGHADLIVGLTNGHMLTLLQGEGGTFLSAGRSIAGVDAAATRMLTGDIDRDGDTDLVLPSGSNSLTVARNNGNGLFSPTPVGPKKVDMFDAQSNATDPTAVV
jgi:hypothetical protein